MLYYLVGLRSFLRVILKHPVHQRDRFRASPRHQILKWHTLVVRDLDHLAVGQALSIRPVIVVRPSENARDLFELI